LVILVPMAAGVIAALVMDHGKFILIAVLAILALVPHLRALREIPAQ
jgi:hypothetical protein